MGRAFHTHTNEHRCGGTRSGLDQGRSSGKIISDTRYNTAAYHCDAGGFDCVLLAAPILSKTAREAKAKKSTVPYQSTQSIPQQNVTKTIIAAVQSTAIKGFIDAGFRPNRGKLTLIVRKSPARSQSNAPSRVPAEGLEARHG